MLNLLSYANQVRQNNTNVDRLIVTDVSPFTIPHIINFRYLVIVFSDTIFFSGERRSRALGLISDSYRYISSTKAAFFQAHAQSAFTSTLWVTRRWPHPDISTPPKRLENSCNPRAYQNQSGWLSFNRSCGEQRFFPP